MVREDIESEVLDEHEIDEAFEPSAPPKPPGRMAGFFMLWTGLALAAVGALLPTAHYLSLPDYQIGERLAELNIENGELLVGGLILLAMGLVVRSTVRAARYQSSPSGGGSRDDSDFYLVADQLATDVAQCLTSVMQISEEVTVLAQSQRDFLQRQTDDEANTDRQENAIFRLAASLDKLNAHIDERVHGLDVQFRSHFDSIANAVHETRALVESRLGAGGLGAAPAPQAPTPAQRQQPAPEPKIDFFENMEMGNQPIPSSFEEHGPDLGQALPPAADPNPPLPGGSNLDSLLPDDSIQRALDHDQFPGLQ